MNNQDFKVFSEAIAVLASVLGQEISPPRLKGFWLVLRRFDWGRVEAALYEAMQRKWYPFPQPADLIALIEGSPEDRAELTWGQLWKLWDNGMTTYASLYCEDARVAECIRVVFGGWLQAGLCPRPDSDEPIQYQTYHKTWVQTYKALAYQQRSYDPYLKGRLALEIAVGQKVHGSLAEGATMLTHHGEAYRLNDGDLKMLHETARARKAELKAQLGVLP
jgi:hypothetical protein